jgi:Trypsin-co-occurring domain 2
MGEESRPEAAIGLAELIVAVRDELEKADTARLDRAEDSLLELREVELELQFEVRRARSGRGGLDFRVLAAGAAGSTPTPAPHTQKLRVLYGPAFKLVEIDEGDREVVPDWLRGPLGGQGLVPEVAVRLEIDDELADLPDDAGADVAGPPGLGGADADADASEV